jgi:hypothetical protein
MKSALFLLLALMVTAPAIGQMSTVPSIGRIDGPPTAPNFAPRFVLVTKQWSQNSAVFAVAGYQAQPDPNHGWHLEAMAFETLEAAMKYLNPGDYVASFYNSEIIGLYELGKPLKLVLKKEKHSEPRHVEKREWETSKWEIEK